jgi:hypothetical protein
MYNSCGDRHCSKCSGSKRYDFAERAEKLLLDGVDYYQVVFTLPSELSSLALSNRESLAGVLFGAAWQSLQQTIRSQQGYDPAAIMVLHTWNQKLDAHWHVHALVPGAGPALDNSGWRTSTAPAESTNSDGHYLVKAETLRESFRALAMKHLQRLRKRGELKLGFLSEFGDLREDAAWQLLTDHLESLEWVSFIQGPPAGSSGPGDLVRYLTRYLTGGPIGNNRIVAADEHNVTFQAREGKQQGGESKQVPITLSTLEFIRRWCLHIQPDQLTKTRYFGGWSNNKQAGYRARCVTAMDAANLPPTARLERKSAAASETSEDLSRQLRCPHCDQPTLRLIETVPRPSWREIFSRRSTVMPSWYADSLDADDRKFWDGVQGAGFYDWYQEHGANGIESAYRQQRGGSCTQPLLPGLEPDHYDALE